MLYLESTNLFIVIDVKVFKCYIICSLPKKKNIANPNGGKQKTLAIIQAWLTDRFAICQWLKVAKSGLLKTADRGLVERGPIMWSQGICMKVYLAC